MFTGLPRDCIVVGVYSGQWNKCMHSFSCALVGFCSFYVVLHSHVCDETRKVSVSVLWK